MKIALVHDQLLEFGGAERVLVALKKIFPHADVYTTVFSYEALGKGKEFFKDWKIYESWFGRLPVIRRFYSPFRFLTPWIWESFDFSEYDLVISSSGSWMSKGVITKPQTFHISYIHHPPRYLYYYPTAISWQRFLPVKIYGHFINHFLRQFDFIASQRPDILLANSKETQRRIEKFYRRDSLVVYPPVDIPKESEVDYSKGKKGFYLTVSRIAKAKHVDVLVKVFSKLKKKLVVVGTGRELESLKRMAGETIIFKGQVSDKELRNLYKRAKAFVFASEAEEFGIAPVEAMGFGLPVIAFASGGVVEYLEHGKNGFLYHSLTEDSLMEVINQFEGLKERQYKEISKQSRKTAERFSFENFSEKILRIVQQNLDAKKL